MKKIDLTINPALAEKILTGFIRTEVTRVGFTKTVLGLSGGIDSALSLYLCARAFGPENVLAVRMPYKTSSPDTLSDAQTMIDDLGVQSLTIEITDMVDPLLQKFHDMDKRRAGNIMARMRMIVLFDQSMASTRWSWVPATKRNSCWGIHKYSAIRRPPCNRSVTCIRPRCASLPKRWVVTGYGDQKPPPPTFGGTNGRG